MFSKKLVLLLIILLFSISCSEPAPRDFDSKVWKSGDYVARAAMIRDINRHHLSKIKNKAQALEILGQPEYKSTYEDIERWRYTIIILPRCRFIWTCTADVSFNRKNDEIIGEVITYD